MANINNEFYERLLVAKAITVELPMSISNAFTYVQDKKDEETTDLVWLRIAGDNISWHNHLLFITSAVLSIPIQQPYADPFSVTRDVLDLDKKYSEWHTKQWTPYMQNLLVKYKDIYKPRLQSKVQRGCIDVVSCLSQRYNITL